MAFHRVSRHAIFVDCLDHDCWSIVADPLGSTRNDDTRGSDRNLGVLDDGSAKHSGLPGDSSTWAVGCPWHIPLGETSHVYQSFADNNGVDDRTTAAISNGLVGGSRDNPMGQTSL